MTSAAKMCPQCGTEYDAEVRFCPRDGATLKSLNAADLIGAVIADRYHVIRKLGEGGMGQVYLAQHVKMGRKSAVKVMHPGMVHDPDAISRFNREASNAAQISHPNVAGIYDFGETSEGMIYLAMEFVEGEPLTAIIAREGALPAVRAARIVKQVGDALAAAHELGIVHRDLKPDNIMIARTRAGGDLVKVVDFGIAKAQGNEGQNVTKTGLVVGTLEYMSPEQLTGTPLDGRSDQYSLAIVAFNTLTGRLPFPANSAQESMIMRLTDPPKRLDEMRPDLAFPPGLQAVLSRGLDRDASARYPSTVEFAADFERAALEGGIAGLGVRPSAATAAMLAPDRPMATPPAAMGA
ncbi:MAG TPA: serine/threonine-protein kinase, partial [Gemmatimonadaceae bacterium]|nr:serine/threonine-protein kinase [Gemmatimonadaceae bacterium]